MTPNPPRLSGGTIGGTSSGAPTSPENRIQQLGVRSVLGPISGAPPERELTRFGAPFSETFDRSIDSNVTPQTASSGGDSTFTPPLYLTKADTQNVFVTFGQVQGITPTNVATNIDVSGTDGTWSIYLNCTIDASGTVTAAEIDSGTTGVPANSTYAAYVLIGEADVASSVIIAVRPSLMFSQGFVACGRDSSNPATTPGIYYFFVS